MISRNKLWSIIKKDIIFKDYNKTILRFYKYIFRGEIIPTPKFVNNILTRNDDLPTYLGIIYLDKTISPKCKEAYEILIS